MADLPSIMALPTMTGCLGAYTGHPPSLYQGDVDVQNSCNHLTPGIEHALIATAPSTVPSQTVSL